MIGRHQLNGTPALVAPVAELRQKLRQGKGAVPGYEVAVAGAVAVHHMEVGQTVPQQVQVIAHRLPGREGGRYVAHAQQAGGVHFLQGLGQLSGGGAQVALVVGQSFHHHGMAGGLPVAGQLPQTADHPFPQDRPGEGVAPMAHGDQGVRRPQGPALVHGLLEIVQGLPALPLAAQHVVEGVGVVLRGVDLHRQLIAVDEGPHLRQTAGGQVRGKGVGPSAPELDVVIPEPFGVGKGPLQGVILISAGKHAQFHMGPPPGKGPLRISSGAAPLVLCCP